MRIGIGHPGASELVNGYVLHDFAKVDREWIDALLAAIADNAPLLARGNDANFMNRVHLATATPTRTRRPGRKAAADGDPKSERRAAPEKAIGNAFAGLKKLFGREPT